MTLLELVGVTRRFGHFVASDDVTFALEEGEVVGLLGANGAGKTTVIRQALGLLTPSGGTVTHFDESPSRRTRSRIGYVPQGLGLWADLSVQENLRFVAHAYEATGGGSQDPADHLPRGEAGLAVFDRSGRSAGGGSDPGSLVGDLSLGRQRRVAFAAALGHEPRLLILDEPTSGVDALARSRLWEMIRARAEDGVGVLVSTHFMDEARQCDRLLIMDTGRIVLRGTSASIVGDRRVVQVDGADWAASFGALDSAGFDCGLEGTSVRVLSEDPNKVGAALADAGLEASVSMRPATLEETMVAVSRRSTGDGDTPNGPEPQL